MLRIKYCEYSALSETFTSSYVHISGNIHAKEAEKKKPVNNTNLSLGFLFIAFWLINDFTVYGTYFLTVRKTENKGDCELFVQETLVITRAPDPETKNE